MIITESSDIQAQINHLQLDYLHNVAQNANALKIMLDMPYVYELQRVDSAAKFLNKTNMSGFCFSSGDFLYLFSICAGFNHKLSVALSLCQNALNAARIFAKQSKNINFIALDKNGELKLKGEQSIDSSVKSGASVFVLPLVNESIYTINDIKKIIHSIQIQVPDFVAFVDISGILPFLNHNLLQMLKNLQHQQVIFLLNARSLGLSDGFMAFSDFLANDLHWKKILQSLYSPLRSGLNNAVLQALNAKLDSHIIDEKLSVYNALKAQFKDSLNLLLPLESSLPNTLNLTFGFNARSALLAKQNILLDSNTGIYQAMGYLLAESSGFLSFSFSQLDSSQMQYLNQSLKETK